MNTNSIHVAAATLLVLLSLTGCEGKLLSGPPQLRLGRDECRECGMIISEDRCCTALLLERAGRREHVLFDDLGCMLDAERAGLDGAVVLERYVRDHSTREWLEASRASFLRADPEKLPTPMSSGMVAFSARAAAERGQGAFGGELFDYPGLAAARKAWFDQRRRAASRPRRRRCARRPSSMHCAR